MGAAGDCLEFEPDCRRCPRLAEFLGELRARYPEYFNRPVASFGPLGARLLIVGLAPGMHGANATGRPFTGDHAGILLYRTIYEHGFSNGPESLHAGDGLALANCRITNAVRCLPPGNKPTGSEVSTCNGYLRWEIEQLPAEGVILALGGVAHRAVLRATGMRQVDARFAHGAQHALPGGPVMLDSYHCSRYNTQTRRLTDTMFADVFRHAAALLQDQTRR